MPNDKVVSHMTIYTDDSSHNSPAYVYAKQYDTFSRFLNIKLMSKTGQVTAGGSYQLNATRPDGATYRTFGTVEDDGTVTFMLTIDMLALPGTLSCDVTIFERPGSQQVFLTSSTFYVVVDASNYSEESVPSFEDVGSVVPMVLVTETQYQTLLRNNQIDSSRLYLIYEQDEDFVEVEEQ